MLGGRDRAAVVGEVALVPVRGHERGEERTADRVRRRGPEPVAPDDEREQGEGDHPVRQLHGGRESEQQAGRGARAVPAPAAGRATSAVVDERRRERLRVEVQPRVDEPRPVLPRALARDAAGQERPDGEERGRADPDPRGARRAAAEQARGDRRGGDAEQRDRGADPPRQPNARLAEQSHGRQRDRPEERPADHGRARRVHRRDDGRRRAGEPGPGREQRASRRASRVCAGATSRWRPRPGRRQRRRRRVGCSPSRRAPARPTRSRSRRPRTRASRTAARAAASIPPPRARPGRSRHGPRRGRPARRGSAARSRGELADHAAGCAGCEHTGRDVREDDAAGADHGTVADRHARPDEPPLRRARRCGRRRSAARTRARSRARPGRPDAWPRRASTPGPSSVSAPISIRAHVEDRAARVDVDPLAERRVPAVVAVERHLDLDTRSPTAANSSASTARRPAASPGSTRA